MIPIHLSASENYDKSILHFDVAINGGGLAGASLACALAPTGLKIALVEAQDFKRVEQDSFDTRYIALTFGSGLVFKNLDLWKDLSKDAITAIKQIVVTNEDRSSFAQLHSKDAGTDVLGWNIAAHAIGNLLVKRIQQCANVTVFSPSQIVDLKSDQYIIELGLQKSHSLEFKNISTALLVIADGGKSGLREKFGFEALTKPYLQRALVCRVATGKAHRGTAFEHFRKSGPLALLPVDECNFSVVWTVEKDKCQQLIEADESEFLLGLQSSFGQSAGSFNKLLSPRISYPLGLSKLRRSVGPRVAVVGNASHTVHPVAGQGFNLALRDIAALAEVLENYARWGWDVGSVDVLGHYERWRNRESKAVTWFTDTMIEAFSNQSRAFALLRDAGLNLAGSSPAIRQKLLARTMGMFGRQSRFLSVHANSN